MMHIKPYVILGIATVCAGAGVAVLVTASSPYAISPVLEALFWISLLLVTWGVFSTLLSIIGFRLGMALTIGACWGVAGDVLGILSRSGYLNWQLSAIVLGVTILLSLLIWWRSRHQVTHA